MANVDVSGTVLIDPTLEARGVRVEGLRFVADLDLGDGEKRFTFTARLTKSVATWPEGDFRLLSYDHTGLLLCDDGAWPVQGLDDTELQIQGEMFTTAIARTELVFRPKDVSGQEPGQDSHVRTSVEAGDVPDYDFGPSVEDFDFGAYIEAGQESGGTQVTPSPVQMRGVAWLRGADKRVSMAALADRLEDYVATHPDAANVVNDLSWHVSRMDATPYVDMPSNQWAWPRPEWEEWAAAVVTALDGVPLHLWRSLRITRDKPKGFWAQIAGRYEEFNVAIHDPKGKYQKLATLEWTAEPLLAGSSLIWSHDYTMTYASGAVDRLAQGLALGSGLESPRGLTVHPLEFL